jgi:hypothetical protein
MPCGDRREGESSLKPRLWGIDKEVWKTEGVYRLMEIAFQIITKYEDPEGIFIRN